MPLIKFADFEKHIKTKKLAPVYLFAGDELYFLERALKEVERLAGADSLNKEVFYAAETTANDILNAVQTMPFLSERRVVVIKDIEKIKNPEAESLISLIENPVETTCLILLYNGKVKKESTAKRKALLAAGEKVKTCVSVDCKKLYEREIGAFIAREFAARGKRAGYGVAEQLIEHCGDDLMNIANEIEKISLYSGKETEITENLIEHISGHTKEINSFMLGNEIEAKNLEKSFFIMEKMLSSGEYPVMLLSQIAQTARKLLNAKSLIEEKGFSESQAAEHLRIHSYFARGFFNNLERHSLKHLKAGMKEILKADSAIKTGSFAESALERLLLFFCG